jgi:hypothetical protein
VTEGESEHVDFKIALLFRRIIIDADSNSVVSRVALRNDDIPLGEQTVAQVTNAVHSIFW